MTSPPKKIKGTFTDIHVHDPDMLSYKPVYSRWVQDPKGYFLIRVLKEKKTVEVGYCTNDNKLVKKIEGKTPQEIYYTVIEHGFLSRLEHAAYLGKELAKAFLSMKYNFPYVQDEGPQDEHVWQ